MSFNPKTYNYRIETAWKEIDYALNSNALPYTLYRTADKNKANFYRLRASKCLKAYIAQNEEELNKSDFVLTPMIVTKKRNGEWHVEIHDLVKYANKNEALHGLTIQHTDGRYLLSIPDNELNEGLRELKSYYLSRCILSGTSLPSDWPNAQEINSKMGASAE